MASKRKLILTIILVAIGVLLIIAAVAWYAIVPGLIQSKLEDAFQSAEQKLGRKITLEDVSLRSLRHVTLKNITVAKKDAEGADITLDKLDLYLAGIPGFADIRLSEIDANDVEILFEIKDGHHNYEDILALLPKSNKDDDGNDDDAEPPAWKRYITPFPDVSVHAVNVVMPDIPIAGNTAVSGLKANDIRVTAKKPNRDEKTQYAVFMDGTITLSEKGTKTEYKSSLQAEVSDKNHGKVSVSMPLSAAGESPSMFHFKDSDDKSYDMKASSLTWTFPTTFSVEAPAVTESKKTLFTADRVDVRLMTLPPTKVSGVYLKEFNLYKPTLNVELNDQGNDMQTFVHALERSLRPAQNKPVDDDEKETPHAKRDVKDYYFSQRFYVDDASLHVHDARSAARGDIQLNHIHLESGYRSIRKIVDLHLTGETAAPLKSTWSVDGVYSMKSEDFRATVDVPLIATNAETKAMREKILSYVRIGSTVPYTSLRLNFFERLLGLVEFNNGTANMHLTLSGNVQEKQADIEADITNAGFAISSPIISSEPVSLDSRIQLSAGIYHDPDFSLEIHQLDITRNQALFQFKGDIDKEHVVKQRNTKNGGASEYDTWSFSLGFELPSQPAQSVFDSIPHALRTELDGLQMRGNIALKLTASGRLDNIDGIVHKFDILPSDDFGIYAWPTNRDINALNTGFLFHVNDPNALAPHDIVIPASTHQVTVFDRARRVMTDTYLPRQTSDDVRVRFPNWVLFEDLNPWLIQLITTTEDGSFFTHEGFSPLQIKAALARNVEKGEFYRGASTNSMQLVKNIFFDRSKTLARKFQEAFYTWAMESVLHIPKQRIMEIYFNIIEFGPEIYGIEDAAKYYFGKRSEALTLNEAAFLIAIIPGPRKGEMYRTQGAVSKGLQKTMNFYIREMYRRKCTPEMLAQMRARFEKRKQPVPFEPCCPSAASLELMQQQPVTFYVPDPHNPAQYDYDPALYLPDGTPLIPVQRSCGYSQQVDDTELGDIFGIFDP